MQRRTLIRSTAALLAVLVRGRANVPLDDVIPQHDADGLVVSEMLDQAEGVGDAALAFLVCVVEVLQTEILPVPEQPQKIAR